LPVFLLELAEPAPIYHPGDNFPHIKRLAEVCADYPMKLRCRTERLLWGNWGLRFEWH
jgi:hypothetical protein